MEQIYHAKLTTLTPIHIGNGLKRLRGSGFIIKGNKLGFIDFDKLIQFMGNNPKDIITLSTAIENGNSLESLLVNKKYELEDICNIVTKTPQLFIGKNELKEQNRSALHGPFIPGSSIKGAIRTIIWNYLIDVTDFIPNFKPRDLYFKNEQTGKYKWNDNKIAKQFFGSDAKENSMRFLKIGDAYFKDIVTEIDEIGIMNLQGYNDNLEWCFKKNSHFLAEMIPIGLDSNFSIKIDIETFEKNKKHKPEIWKKINTNWLSNSKGLTDIAAIINNYTKYFLNLEGDLKQEKYAPHEAMDFMQGELDFIYNKIEVLEKTGKGFIIRLGGNSGWQFTTGGWVFSKDNNDDSKSLVNKFSTEELRELKKSIQKNKEYPIDYPIPKTRKMRIDGMPLGFVEVSF